MQGSSDSLLHPSHRCEALTSVFGIAVWVLLRTTSLPHCMVSSPAPAKDCPSLPLRVATLPLRLSCSEVQGPPVLLSYYLTTLISCGLGVLSSLLPFLGCLSGSSEIAWGFMEPLRTYELRCSASGCALHTNLGLGWAPWVIPCYVFSLLSFMERGCGVLFFHPGFCGEDSGPSLAPRFAGFTVPAQPMRDNHNGRLFYPVRAVRCYLVRFGCASSAMRAVPFCRKV